MHMPWERLSVDNPKRPVAVGRVVWPSRRDLQDHHRCRTERLVSLSDAEILARRRFWAAVLGAAIPEPADGEADPSVPDERPRSLLPATVMILAFCLIPAAFRLAAKWPQISVPSLLLIIIGGLALLELRQRVVRRLRNALMHDECPACGFDCSHTDNIRRPCPECGYPCPLLPPPVPT